MVLGRRCGEAGIRTGPQEESQREKGGGDDEPELRGGIRDLVDEQLSQTIDVLLFDSSSFL